MTIQSSWISSIAYKRIGEESYVAIFLKDEEKPCGSCGGRGYVSPILDTTREARPCRDCFRTGKISIPVALLYGGPESPIPSWLPGLIQAGTGGKSVGHAYHKLLKGKFPYQKVEGWREVSKLKEMMK